MGDLCFMLKDGTHRDFLTGRIVPDPFDTEACDDLGGWKPPSGKGPYQGV